MLRFIYDIFTAMEDDFDKIISFYISIFCTIFYTLIRGMKDNSL